MDRKKEIELKKEKIYNEIDELDSLRLCCEKLRDEAVIKLLALDNELKNLQ